MNQITELIECYSSGFLPLSNYYSGNEERRRRFADALRKGLEERADESRSVLCVDLKDCDGLDDLLRRICRALGAENADRPGLSLFGLQRIARSLDRSLEKEGKNVCLLLESFEQCGSWEDPDFSWFREFLYHTGAFSCITVSASPLEDFAHRPPFGSPLSNIFTVMEEIPEAPHGE